MKKYIRPEIEIEKLETDSDIMLLSKIFEAGTDEEGNKQYGVEYEQDIGIFG